MKNKMKLLALLLIVALTFSLMSCDLLDLLFNRADSPISLDEIPEFDGVTPYVHINGGTPFFEESEIVLESYERFAELDALGRCGVTEACIGVDIMPTEERESISHVYPSGWVQAEYDKDLVDGRYLYNRCHLIGFQLTGENDNKQNLITGTKFMNNEGMLPFENQIADYVKETNNHVLYRVTPIFEGNNLVANGVLLEAMSCEDRGEDILICVYIYNCQPGIVINYLTGESYQDGTTPPAKDDTTPSEPENAAGYVLNTSSKRFHKPDCSGAASIAEQNKESSNKTREELIADGYSPCGTCKP